MPGGKLARILVPIDASEGAGRAAAFAVNLAEITGADVDVLHVTYFDKDIFPIYFITFACRLN